MIAIALAITLLWTAIFLMISHALSWSPWTILGAAFLVFGIILFGFSLCKAAAFGEHPGLR